MPQLIERIIKDLNKSGRSLSTAVLARDYLGVGVLDEERAEALLGRLLEGEPRLLRGPLGWSAVSAAVPASPSACAPIAARSATSLRFDSPFTAIFAPLAHTSFSQDGSATSPGDARYLVALGGEREVMRARTRGLDLVATDLPIVHLSKIARHVGLYSGPSDPAAMARAFGVPHLDGCGIDAASRMIASVWKALVDILMSRNVFDFVGLEQMLDERLETADFSRKSFGLAELGQIDDGPGIYIFRERCGRELYVGQSRHLRRRVCSCFMGPPRDEKDRAIRARADAMETESTDTPLDAMILEARLIRRWKPELNTQRRVHGVPPEDGILLLPRNTRGNKKQIEAAQARGARFVEAGGRSETRDEVSLANGPHPGHFDFGVSAARAMPPAQEWIAYVVASGALRCRAVLRGSNKQRRRAALRAVAALAQNHCARPAAREAASLVAAWLKLEPKSSWLTLISAAGSEALACKVVSESASLE